MNRFPHINSELPYIDSVQMREVDRLMIEEFKINLHLMMENAGRNLAVLARERFLGGQTEGKNVIVLAGAGGNGGGGLVAARHLKNWGANVIVHSVVDHVIMKSTTRFQAEILLEMGVSVKNAVPGQNAISSDLIIDSLLGYSISGAPRGKVNNFIQWTQKQKAKIISLDLPSGMDPNSGYTFDPCIKADATLTLALPKTCFQNEKARENCGEIYLCDISVPANLYSQPSLNLLVGNLFNNSEIVRLS